MSQRRAKGHGTTKPHVLFSRRNLPSAWAINREGTRCLNSGQLSTMCRPYNHVVRFCVITNAKYKCVVRQTAERKPSKHVEAAQGRKGGRGMQPPSE